VDRCLPGGGLKGQVRQHVSGHRVIVRLARSTQRSEQVSLGQPVLASVQRHPSRELTDLSEDREQAALHPSGMVTLTQKQSDRPELRPHVGQVAAAVGVVEALQQWDALLDLSEQRVTYLASFKSGCKPACAVRGVPGGNVEDRLAGDGEKVPAVEKPSNDPILRRPRVLALDQGLSMSMSAGSTSGDPPARPFQSSAAVTGRPSSRERTHAASSGSGGRGVQPLSRQ
jgi:hypothetical protein